MTSRHGTGRRSAPTGNGIEFRSRAFRVPPPRRGGPVGVHAAPVVPSPNRVAAVLLVLLLVVVLGAAVSFALVVPLGSLS